MGVDGVLHVQLLDVQGVVVVRRGAFPTVVSASPGCHVQVLDVPPFYHFQLL